MELKDFKIKYTTIFLGDAIPPNKLVLLKRGAHMPFEPNRYTGLGGKIGDKEEFKNETPLESALRELKEEAGFGHVSLQEFGRIIINNDRILIYFFGLLNQEDLPPCPEGELKWTSIDQVLNKDIIPTTKLFVTKWSENSWSLNPFTIFQEREDKDDPHSCVIGLEFKEGLHS